MPIFEFQGRDSHGKKINGKKTASSIDALNTQLTKENIIPIKIALLPSEQFKEDIISRYFPKKISTDELSLLARQMYTLSKSGVSTELAIKQIAENARSDTMGKVLRGLVESLEQGKDLASSMQLYPAIFTPIMVSMVRVGQNSGQLDQAFLQLNQYLELEASTFKKAKTLARYPIFVFSSIIAAIVIVNVFVIPSFAKTFADANIRLPAITKILIATSKFITTNGYYIGILLSIFIILIFYYSRQPAGKLWIGKNILRLPLIGKIAKHIILLRFSQTFAIVAKAGVSIPEGVMLIAQAMKNDYAKQQILLMGQSIQRGKSLTQSIMGNDLFTHLEIQLFAVSEQTGELVNMLNQIADFYHREIDYDLKRLSDMIEPVILIFMAALVLFLAFAVYLPIWNMVYLVHR